MTNYSYTSTASGGDSAAKSDSKGKAKGKSKDGSRLAGWLFRMTFIGLVVFGLAFVVGVNFQPWLRVGEQVALLITENPIVWLVSWVPFLGGFADWLLVESVNVAKTAAMVAWATAQFTQTFPMVAKYLKRKGFIKKGLTKKFQIIRVLSYVVEVLVAAIAYPPYQGGWGTLMADLNAQALEMSYIDGWNIITAIITIALFEAYCAVCIEVWRIISE